MTPEERILSFCERLPRDMKLSPAHELLIFKEIKAAVKEEREACAQIADESAAIAANNARIGSGKEYEQRSDQARTIASWIRARSGEKGE